MTIEQEGKRMSDDLPDEPRNGEGDSFAELLESYTTGMGEDVRVGDRIRGEILSIGKESVFVDTGTKIDGVVDKEELLDEGGELPYEVGETIELYVVAFNGNEIKLSKALSGAGGLMALQEAYQQEIPVEGKIKGQIKGGFHVEIMGKKAFCPVSQMDVTYTEDLEQHIGKTYPFLITQFEERGRNIVLSRAELLRREQKKAAQAFLKALEVGRDVDGRVTRLMPYGAFIEIFPGVEGLLHISEISWSRLETPNEVLNVGDSVRVKIIGMEKGEGGRISLSIKQMEGDPWERLEDTVRVGAKLTGKVRRCMGFGAFVEIFPGIEGLVHISEMSYTKRVMKPEEVVSVGDRVPVVVKAIDVPRRRISLSIKDAEGDPWLEVPERYKTGQSLQGILEKKEKFGYFVSLEPGVTGLIPLSKIRELQKPSLVEKLKEGDSIQVFVERIQVEERKITLAPADVEDEKHWQRFVQGAEKPSGILAQKLKQALEEKE
jgi:small subunit ribosomal protein S1